MGHRYIPAEGLEYVPDEVFPKIQRYIVQEDDVIISIVGTIGLVSIIDSRFHLASQTENAAKLTGLDSIDAHYLYYYLSSHLGQAEIYKGTVGAVQPKLPLYSIEKIPVPWPDRDTRKAISNQLSSLDDKIQLNHQINQTLEQMAQAIFKSWFVDFEPVKAKISALEAGGSEDDALLAAMQAISGKTPEDLTRLQAEQPEQYAELRATAELFPSAMQESALGEIPEGWKVGCLADLLYFNPRRALKKGIVAPYLDMKNVPTSGHLADEVIEREFGSGTKFINGDTLLARITPCLENGKTAYVDFLDEGQVGWGSTEYIVISPKKGYPSSLGYVIARDTHFRQHATQSMTGTSGRQRANAKALADTPWIIYPEAITHVFDKIASGYLKLAKRHGDQSKSLAELRDTLLPKLLSGELSVSDAETQLTKTEDTADV